MRNKGDGFAAQVELRVPGVWAFLKLAGNKAWCVTG